MKSYNDYDDDDGVSRDLDHFAFDSDSESDDDVADDVSDETACTDCECIEWLHQDDGHGQGQAHAHHPRAKVCLSSLAPLSFCRRPSATNGSPVLGPVKAHHRLSLPRTSGSPINSLVPNFTKHQRASTGGGSSVGGHDSGAKGINRPHHIRRQSDGIIWARWDRRKDSSSSGDNDDKASANGSASPTLAPRLGRTASSASLAKINVEGQMSPTQSRSPSFSAGRPRSHSDPRAMLVQLTPLRAT